MKNNPYILKKEVLPVFYNIEITPDFKELSFHGKEEIEINILKEINEITLNISELKISKASLKQTENYDVQKINYNEKYEMISFVFKNKLKKGKATLKLEYDGKISDKLKGRPLSFETKQKMKAARQNISLETRLKISRALKGKPKKRRKSPVISRPNKLETECINLFKENGLPLKFVGDYSEGFFIEGKIPDFVSTNNKKVLVEVFCDYYKVKQYGSVENYKTMRDNLFSKHGWKTLFFSDKDIKLKTEDCINKIKKEMN